MTCEYKILVNCWYLIRDCSVKYIHLESVLNRKMAKNPIVFGVNYLFFYVLIYPNVISFMLLHREICFNNEPTIGNFCTSCKEITPLWAEIKNLYYLKDHTNFLRIIPSEI